MPKLQIFFICGPFQYFFFLIREKAVTLLIDLGDDLVYAVLCYIGYLLERLGPGYLVVKFVFGRTRLFFAVGIEKIVTPVEELVDPDAAVMSPAHAKDKKEPCGGPGEIGDIDPCITACHGRKIDEQV